MDPHYPWAFNQRQACIIDEYTRIGLGLLCVWGEQRD